MIPKFHEFLEKYPTLYDLAEASPSEVRKTWYPLGYNVRPYRLHGIACEAVERYGGSIPNQPEELLSMKGIGVLFPAISIVLLAMANKAIKRDEDLVKSVDRIR